jgi:hypothetical protein
MGEFRAEAYLPAANLGELAALYDANQAAISAIVAAKCQPRMRLAGQSAADAMMRQCELLAEKIVQEARGRSPESSADRECQAGLLLRASVDWFDLEMAAEALRIVAVDGNRHPEHRDTFGRQVICRS